jgi:hypothetical protein
MPFQADPLPPHHARSTLRGQHGTGAPTTVLGVLPIRPDGQAFYYSDYTRHASKGFLRALARCSGTAMIARTKATSGCHTDATGL